jgi:hypothetical protein
MCTTETEKQQKNRRLSLGILLDITPAKLLPLGAAVAQGKTTSAGS